MTEHVRIDPNSLTLAEVEVLEDLSGCPFTWLGDPNRPKGRLMRALVVVAKRREDPAFSWEAAGQLTIEVLGQGVAVDPPAAVA